MSGHKFKIGQLVNYFGRVRASGIYQVTQLLPLEAKRTNTGLRTSTSPMSAWLKSTNFMRSKGSFLARSSVREHATGRWGDGGEEQPITK